MEASTATATTTPAAINKVLKKRKPSSKKKPSMTAKQRKNKMKAACLHFKICCCHTHITWMKSAIHTSL